MAERRFVGYRLHAGNMSLDVARILSSVERIEQLHRIRVDHGRLHRWLAESCLRTGRRAEAARHWVVAARHGELAVVTADLRALVAQRLPGRVRRTHHRSAQPDWADDAQEWLDVLAQPAVGPVAR